MARNDVLALRRARVLGRRLSNCAEFQAWVRASEAVRADPVAQHLMRQIEACRVAAWVLPDGDDANAKRRGLEIELEALGTMKEFQQAERSLRKTLDAVDAVISASAGVLFASNAKRTCGCQ